MHFGESFGDACRFCGSTRIIVAPPSSAGACAQCSREAKAWAARQELLAEHQAAMARVLIDGGAEERRTAERLHLRAQRRAALIEGARAGVRRVHAVLLKALPQRSRTAHNY